MVERHGVIRSKYPVVGDIFEKKTDFASNRGKTTIKKRGEGAYAPRFFCQKVILQ